MYYLPGIFAIIVLAAGWHYAFFSSAAMKLAAVENPQLNARRVLMRRDVLRRRVRAFLERGAPVDPEVWRALEGDGPAAPRSDGGPLEARDSDESMTEAEGSPGER